MADYETALTTIAKLRLDGSRLSYEINEAKACGYVKKDILPYFVEKWENIIGDQIRSQALATLMLDAQITSGENADAKELMYKVHMLKEDVDNMKYLKAVNYTFPAFVIEAFTTARIESMLQRITDRFPNRQPTVTELLDKLTYVIQIKNWALAEESK